MNNQQGQLVVPLEIVAKDPRVAHSILHWLTSKQKVIEEASCIGKSEFDTIVKVVKKESLEQIMRELIDEVKKYHQF